MMNCFPPPSPFSSLSNPPTTPPPIRPYPPFYRTFNKLRYFQILARAQRGGGGVGKGHKRTNFTPLQFEVKFNYFRFFSLRIQLVKVFQKKNLLLFPEKLLSFILFGAMMLFIGQLVSPKQLLTQFLPAPPIMQFDIYLCQTTQKIPSP